MRRSIMTDFDDPSAGTVEVHDDENRSRHEDSGQGREADVAAMPDAASESHQHHRAGGNGKDKVEHDLRNVVLSGCVALCVKIDGVPSELRLNDADWAAKVFSATVCTIRIPNNAKSLGNSI